VAEVEVVVSTELPLDGSFAGAQPTNSCATARRRAAHQRVGLVGAALLEVARTMGRATLAVLFPVTQCPPVPESPSTEHEARLHRKKIGVLGLGEPITKPHSCIRPRRLLPERS